SGLLPANRPRLTPSSPAAPSDLQPRSGLGGGDLLQRRVRPKRCPSVKSDSELERPERHLRRLVTEEEHLERGIVVFVAVTVSCERVSQGEAPLLARSRSEHLDAP